MELQQYIHWCNERKRKDRLRQEIRRATITFQITLKRRCSWFKEMKGKIHTVDNICPSDYDFDHNLCQQTDLRAVDVTLVAFLAISAAASQG
jgi:hypothetical protein